MFTFQATFYILLQCTLLSSHILKCTITQATKIKEMNFSGNYHTTFDVKEKYYRKVLKVKAVSRHSQFHSSNLENNSQL